ncbi:MAG: hypothetical protein ACJ790_21505 [Myxococcaceae bacterium]
MAPLATIHEMLTGPGSFRFVLQPLVALVLALRDAKRDVVEGNPPFLLSLFIGARRRDRVKQGLRQIVIPLVIATVLDGVLQVVITGHLRVVQAVLTGGLLIAFPYSGGRGLFNRFLRTRTPRHA